jgi:predicted DNA-binding protein (MmcQ/YjbR family)
MPSSSGRARKPTNRRPAARQAEAELMKFALAYPTAREDSPWGERVAKVGKKIFVFFHVPSDSLNVTVKLPDSAGIALGLPFVKPTGYGLGKSGWVTATFGPKDVVPLPMLKQWIDESYRAIAPKLLVKELSPAAPPKARKPKAG